MMGIYTRKVKVHTKGTAVYTFDGISSIVITDGHLVLSEGGMSGDTVAMFAPGMWARVEREVSSSN